MEEYFFRSFASDIVKSMRSIEGSRVERISEIFDDCDRVFLFGNGGSHAIAEHISNDLIKRCGIKSLTLSNMPLMTCFTNDYSYEEAWIKYLESFEPTYNDVVVLISSSGKSENFNKTLEWCKKNDILAITIYGFEYKENIDVESDISIYVDSDNYGIVEMATEIILHSVVEQLVKE